VFPDAREDEIEKITNGIKTERHPRNLGSYITALAERGDLLLPCDLDASLSRSHSEACRHGDGRLCPKDGIAYFSECRCHVTGSSGPE
jgi:hypothetical protein